MKIKSTELIFVNVLNLLKTLKTEGMACKMESIDGWKNKAKSMAFEKSHGKSQKFSSNGLWRMGAPVEIKKNGGLWED